MYDVVCPSCGRAHRLEFVSLGKAAQCRHCGHRFTIGEQHVRQVGPATTLDTPASPEDMLHRLSRSAGAGASGEEANAIAAGVDASRGAQARNLARQLARQRTLSTLAWVTFLLLVATVVVLGSFWYVNHRAGEPLGAMARSKGGATMPETPADPVDPVAPQPKYVTPSAPVSGSGQLPTGRGSGLFDFSRRTPGPLAPTPTYQQPTTAPAESAVTPDNGQ